MKKIKHILIAITLLCTASVSRAQIESPVKWSYGAKKLSPQEAVIFIKATIDEGWHIYAQHMDDGGPVKTAFTFTPSADYSLAGTPSEPTPVKKYENVFSMEVKYFEKTVTFQQKIRLNTAQTVIKGSVKYMTCTDQQCLPPDEVSFSIPIK